MFLACGFDGVHPAYSGVVLYSPSFHSPLQKGLRKVGLPGGLLGFLFVSLCVCEDDCSALECGPDPNLPRHKNHRRFQVLMNIPGM